MLDSRISVDPSALRNPFGKTAVSAVRAVQPVVRRADDERTSSRSRAPGTSYTPNTDRDNRSDKAPLYSRTGAPANSSGVFVASSLDRTDSFKLQVRTAEGDVATLRFSSSSSFSASALAVQTDTASAQALSVQSSQSSDLQVRVKGDLNAQERAAIDALAQQVSEVADDFFGGNMDAALQGASQIDISGQAGTLSAYAFSLKTRETQTAAAIYDNVAQTTAPLDVPVATAPAPASTPTPAAPSPAQNSKDLLKSLLAFFDRFTGGSKEPAAASAPTTGPTQTPAPESAAPAALAA